jgi:DNA-binding YbaB/EbfC family protein
MFDKMKELYQMQKQAKKIKKELTETKIEVQKLDGRIKMAFTGEYNIKELTIDSGLLKEENKRLLEENLQQAINEASSKIRDIMMDKMKQSMGGINLPDVGI